MKHFALTALALALVFGILLRGSFIHWLIVIGAWLYLGIPLALTLALWLIFALKRTGEAPLRFRSLVLVAAMTGGSLLLSLTVGTGINHWAIREARAYVATVVPKLDAYHNEHGHYPNTLAELNAPSPPRLLRNAHGYSANSGNFRFEYRDHAGVMDGFCFEGTTREWTRFD